MPTAETLLSVLTASSGRGPSFLTAALLGAAFLAAGDFFLLAGAFLAVAFLIGFLFVAIVDTLVHPWVFTAQVPSRDSVGCGHI